MAAKIECPECKGRCVSVADYERAVKTLRGIARGSARKPKTYDQAIQAVGEVVEMAQAAMVELDEPT